MGLQVWAGLQELVVVGGEEPQLLTDVAATRSDAAPKSSVLSVLRWSVQELSCLDHYTMKDQHVIGEIWSLSRCPALDSTQSMYPGVVDQYRDKDDEN